MEVSFSTSNTSPCMGSRVNFYYLEVKPKRAILLKIQKKMQTALIFLSNQPDFCFWISI